MSKLIKNTKEKPQRNIIRNRTNWAQNTLDQIPTPASNARSITGLVKEGGKVTGYRLSDNTVLDKVQAVQLAHQGGIAGALV